MNVYVRNLIGARTAAGTYPSEIIQAAFELFNPVTQRTQSQSPVFSRLQTFPLEQDIDNNINPYIYLLGADDNNVTTVSTFMQSFGQILKSELGCTTVLGAAFGLTSGIGIQVHYYSHMSYPTWHSSQAQPGDGYVTAAVYASTVGYMVQFPRVPANEFTPYIYLRREQAQDDVARNDPDQPVLFNTRKHVLPEVLHFNPWDKCTSAIQLNIINGIHIERDHIAGFAVPTANPNDSLVKTNSQFLKSAIPAYMIVPAFYQTANYPFV